VCTAGWRPGWRPPCTGRKSLSVGIALSSCTRQEWSHQGAGSRGVRKGQTYTRVVQSENLLGGFIAIRQSCALARRGANPDPTQALTPTRC
jgi:hypothetical protein